MDSRFRGNDVVGDDAWGLTAEGVKCAYGFPRAVTIEELGTFTLTPALSRERERGLLDSIGDSPHVYLPLFGSEGRRIT